MPLPPNYVPRKGDIVTLTAKVAYDSRPDETFVYLSIGVNNVSVSRDHLVDLNRQQLHIGELVELVGPGQLMVGRVRALCDDYAWVRSDDGSMGTYMVNFLRVVPPADEASENEGPLPEQRSDGGDSDAGEIG